MKKLITLACIIIGTAAYAQETTDSLQVNKASAISFKAGSGFISGDGPTSVGITFGVGYEKNLSQSLILALNLDAGSLPRSAYSDAYSYSSTTSFFQLSANIKYNLLKPTSSFFLAPFVGLGFASYNAKVSDGGSVIRVANGSAADPKNIADLAIPLGFELSKVLGQGRIGLEYTISYLTSDRFDGTIGTDGATFDGHRGSGKIEDLGSGTTGKTNNDLWTGVRISYTRTLGNK
jgi:hypothetical protein